MISLPSSLLLPPQVFKDLLVPAFLGQATVIFTLMHVFCYLGMYFFGGRIEASQAHWAALPVPASLYYLLNFNTYREGMLTLFMLVRLGKGGRR